MDHTEGWALENWCFPTVVLEMILDSPLAGQEMQPVHPKGDHSWIFIVSTDGDTEAPILWSHDARRQLIGKDPDAGKDRRQGEKGTTEDAMVGWHHQLNGHEFEQASGVGEGQGSWHAAVQGVTKSQSWLGDWITMKLHRLWIHNASYCIKRSNSRWINTENWLFIVSIYSIFIDYSLSVFIQYLFNLLSHGPGGISRVAKTENGGLCEREYSPKLTVVYPFSYFKCETKLVTN